MLLNNFSDMRFWRRFGLMLILACAAYLALFICPLQFFDDSLRIYTHTSINQGVHGRPMADVVFALFSGALFMDFSPLSQIYSLAFLLMAGVFICGAFNGLAPEKARGIMAWSPLFFALQPLFYSILAFRFDCLTISLGLLCAAAAFYFTCRQTGLRRYGGGALALWLSLSLYQPTTAIYYVAIFALAANLVVRQGIASLWHLCKHVVIVSLLAGVAYLPVYLQAVRNANRPFCGLPLHPYVAQHMRIDSGLAGIWQGISGFVQALLEYARLNPVFLILCAIAVGACLTLLFFRTTFRKRLVALACLCCSLASCGGMLVALSESMFPARCLVTLPVFSLCLLLTLLVNSSGFVLKCTAAVAWACIFFSASLVSIYADAERDQHEFEQQIVLQPLWQDIAAFLHKNEKKEYSFYVTGSQMPTHYNVATVNERYLPLGVPTPAAFVAMRLMSWLPLKYDLAASMGKIELANYRLLASKTGYRLYLAPKDILVIELLGGYAPRKVPAFESARYFSDAPN